MSHKLIGFSKYKNELGKESDSLRLSHHSHFNWLNTVEILY